METIKAKIEQNKADQAKLQEEQERLEAELKAQKEPVLRHLDYGYEKSGRGFVWTNCGLTHDTAFFDDGMCCSRYLAEKHYSKHNTTIGNIFGDLNRNKEDLDEFKEFDDTGDALTVCTMGRSRQHVNIETTGEFLVNIEEAKKIHQKLGQLIATVKRNQK